MGLKTVSFTPYRDNNTGQNLSFVNLPIDQLTSVHRDQVTATDIPAAAAGPQTALVGAVYQGAEEDSALRTLGGYVRIHHAWTEKGLRKTKLVRLEKPGRYDVDTVEVPVDEFIELAVPSQKAKGR